MSFEKYLELKRLVDIYDDLVDIRIRIENRLRAFPGETRAIYPEQLEKIETAVREEIMQLVQEVPIWKAFLSKWRGLGPCLAGALIAAIMVRFVERPPQNELELQWALKTKGGATLVPELRGIVAFDNPSKLHAFCGLDVRDGKAPKRQRGKPIDWNPKMRVLAWKIGEQFVKQGGYYRKVYEEARAVYDARPDLQKGKGAKAHRHAMARRKMVKQFLTDLWIAWRQLEGLSIVSPYVIDKLHHKHYRAPPALGDRGETPKSSRQRTKNHQRNASQLGVETHIGRASRLAFETHTGHASQQVSETHIGRASQSQCGTYP